MYLSYKKEVTKILLRGGVIVDGPNPWDIQIHDEIFFKLFLKNGRLALGETYMNRLWDCDDIAEMVSRLTRGTLVSLKDKKDLKLLGTLIKAKMLPAGDIKRSHIVGEKHYDIGNELYSSMLDDRMVYTCGYFQYEDDLNKAQEAKLEISCRKLKLEPGMHVLDIGCGWGSFARYAAERHGVKVTGISISQKQVDLANEVCKGLDVNIKYCDYRNIEGQFDRVVSIGMFEHVGKEYYRVYFEKVKTLLRDEGIFLLHTLGANTSKWSNDWLTKYIFPGGYVPSLPLIMKALEDLWVVEDLHNFGTSYDPTLLEWFRRFDQSWPEIQKDYDDKFYRMWKFFLLSSAGVLRSRYAQLWQIVLTKKGILGGYHYEGNYSHN